jgi:DNA-binding NtrC family response regulator
MKTKGNFQEISYGMDFVPFKDYLPSGNEKSIHEKTVMKRLLLVDDDPDHRLILRTRFEARGYECEEAEDGGVALSTLKKDQIALVITELNMPRMNGLQLFGQMAKLSLLQTTPTILVTSRSKVERFSKAYELGTRAVISKLYDCSKLLEEVGRAIGEPKTVR